MAKKGQQGKEANPHVTRSKTENLNSSIGENLKNANAGKSINTPKIAKSPPKSSHLSSSLRKLKASKSNAGGNANSNAIEIEIETISTDIPLLPEVNDASTAGSISRLTSKNLSEHNKNREEPKNPGEWEPPPATVNERLIQARNFLSDEDVYSHEDFASRHQTIGKFLAKLATEKIEYDTGIFNEVQAMHRTHQGRMNTQNHQIPQQADDKPNSSHPLPFEWTTKFFDLLSQQFAIDAGDQRQTLRGIGKSLNPDADTPNDAEAAELLAQEVLRENCNNAAAQPPSHEENWGFASELPDETGPNHFFSLDRLPAANKTASAAVAVAPSDRHQKMKRHIIEHPYQEPRPKRKKKTRNGRAQAQSPILIRNQFSVPYSPLWDPNGPPSRRLPPEELGFDEHREASREHTPELGNGDLMPNEICRFDFAHDAQMVLDAADPKETHFPGDPIFPFGETPFVQSLISKRIERELASDFNTLSTDIQDPIRLSPDPIDLKSTRFALPAPHKGEKIASFDPVIIAEDPNPSRPLSERTTTPAASGVVEVDESVGREEESVSIRFTVKGIEDVLVESKVGGGGVKAAG